jgi:hypothetical protein
MEAHEGQGRPAKSLADELLKRFMVNADSTEGKMIKLTERKKEKKFTMRISFLFGLIRACHPRGLTYRVLNAALFVVIRNIKHGFHLYWTRY